MRKVFHLDAIQALVGKYASEPFEVEVHCLPREDIFHPVIVVPEGVRVPVIVKADLSNEAKTGKNLLSEGDLYFRTLRSNGTPSSAKIRPSDYRDLLEICFENREADIGRFLRRHMGGFQGEALSALLPSKPNPMDALKSRCAALIARGDHAYEVNMGKAISHVPAWMPTEPLTMSAALCLEPAKDGTFPTREFLQAFVSGNPNYTGWPMWLDSSKFADIRSRPKVKDSTWQALMVDLDSEWPHLDFELMDPRGEFYLRRIIRAVQRYGTSSILSNFPTPARPAR